jgi:hypothetical protein
MYSIVEVANVREVGRLQVNLVYKANCFEEANATNQTCALAWQSTQKGRSTIHFNSNITFNTLEECAGRL